MVNMDPVINRISLTRFTYKPPKEDIFENKIEMRYFVFNYFFSFIYVKKPSYISCEQRMNIKVKITIILCIFMCEKC